MRVHVWLGIVWTWVVVGAGPVVWAAEVPYTLEDRDRLIRIEAILKEFKESVAQRFDSVDKRFDSVDKRIDSVDKRFDSVDKRIDSVDKRFDSVDKRFDSVDKRIDSVDKRIERLETVMLGGFGLLFTSMIGLVGFVLWDRRTALAPAIRTTRELAEREERLESALKEIAQRDPNVAEALRHVGLL